MSIQFIFDGSLFVKNWHYRELLYNMLIFKIIKSFWCEIYLNYDKLLECCPIKLSPSVLGNFQIYESKTVATIAPIYIFTLRSQLFRFVVSKSHKNFTVKSNYLFLMRKQQSTIDCKKAHTNRTSVCTKALFWVKDAIKKERKQ